MKSNSDMVLARGKKREREEIVVSLIFYAD